MRDTSTSNKRTAPGRGEILLVLSLCLLATMTIRMRTEMFSPTTPSWNEPVDHWKYEYVAEHPLGSFHIQPMCWRIGVPLLTRLLPFSTYRNFEILTILFYVLSGFIIYLWLLAIPRPRDEAILGVILFYSMGAVVKLVLGGVETPDPGSYFFTLLALYAIYTGQDFLCAAALALGMFTKETLMVAVPLHYSLKAAGLFDMKRLRRSILVGAPAVIVFVAIRMLIPAWNDRDDYVRSLPFIYTQVSAGKVNYDLRTAFEGTIRTYRDYTPVDLLRLFTWGSLGVPFFLPFFDLKENRKLLIRWAPYVFPILATLLIALNADRRMGSLFPVLIVMGLNGVRALSARLDASTRDFQVIFLLLFALQLLKTNVAIVPFDLSAAVFLFSIGWLLYRRQPRYRIGTF